MGPTVAPVGFMWSDDIKEFYIIMNLCQFANFYYWEQN